MKKIIFFLPFFLIIFVPTMVRAERMHGVSNLVQRSLTIKSIPIDTSYIPRGAKRVRMLRLKMTASCDDDVRVWSVGVRRVGLGDSQYVRGVYLMEGVKRLSRPARISGADEMAHMRAYGFLVPACKSRTVDVAVDFSNNTPVGSEYHFRIDDDSNFITNAHDIHANYPLLNVKMVDVTPEDAGEVTIEFLRVGSIGVIRDEVVAKFRVTANGSTHYMIHGITLKNAGSAKNLDIRELYITRNRAQPLTNMQKKLDKKYVTLTFRRPYFLRRKANIIFELHGKAFTGNETVNFILEEGSDLKAIPSRRGGRRLGN